MPMSADTSKIVEDFEQAYQGQFVALEVLRLKAALREVRRHRQAESLRLPVASYLGEFVEADLLTDLERQELAAILPWVFV